MSLIFKEAVDDIHKMVYDVFPGTIHWESVKTDRVTSETSWMSFVIRHASARQDSLGGIGSRSFLRTGTAIAAIFSPIGKGLQESYTLAKTVNDAYEGKTSPNGIWFRNVRIQEIGRDGDFFQINVIIDFEYYETK
jgi:hypothetical protein